MPYSNIVLLANCFFIMILGFRRKTDSIVCLNDWFSVNKNSNKIKHFFTVFSYRKRRKTFKSQKLGLCPLSTYKWSSFIYLWMDFILFFLCIVFYSTHVEIYSYFINLFKYLWIRSLFWLVWSFVCCSWHQWLLL